MAGKVKGVSAAAAAQRVANAGKKRESVRGKGDIKVDKFTTEADGSVKLGTAEIEGRIFKPAVFFVLARSDHKYKGLQFQSSFTSRIMSGALKRPF